MLTRRLDVGLVSSDIDNPCLVSESLMEHPLVCIMPAGHALAARRLVRPADLDGRPFVSFDPESFTGQRIAATIGEQGGSSQCRAGGECRADAV